MHIQVQSLILILRGCENVQEQGILYIASYKENRRVLHTHLCLIDYMTIFSACDNFLYVSRDGTSQYHCIPACSHSGNI